MKLTKKACEMTQKELAAYIDQSVLKPDFTEEDIVKYIQEGIDFGCKTVCINPASLTIARKLCKGTDTGLCVVCDFPFGCSSTESKVAQANIILSENDIEDLDIVSNYGWIRSGKWDEVKADIQAVADAAHAHHSNLKVILETDALTIEQVKKATDVFCEAGADFVKTSTGFFTGNPNAVGATPELIRVILDTVNGRCKVKGAGAIRDQKRFFELIDMGIDRMGVGYRSTPTVLGLK